MRDAKVDFLDHGRCCNTRWREPARGCLFWCTTTTRSASTLGIAYTGPGVGRPDKAWDDAVAHGWNVISIKTDWKEVFPPKKN